MDVAFWTAVLIFGGAYALIISEKIHRTTIVLAAAGLLVVLGVINQAAAFSAIDYNTLGLLIGMMVIVAITKRTGLFQWAALTAARVAKGDPVRILVYLSLVACVFSMFLANITTVVLICPVTFVIANHLKINPIPYIISQLIMINLGGLGTLIGDPVNILIGSASGLTFLDFLINNTLLVLGLVPVAILIIYLYFKKDFHASEEDKQSLMALNPKDAIKDKGLLVKSVSVLFITIGTFVISNWLPIELLPATVALFGAGLLLAITGTSPDEILPEVEWSTIMFFAGLFILIAGVEHVGFIDLLAEKLVEVTQGSQIITTMVILWASGLLSGFIDNIPYAATMIPLVQQLPASGIDISYLWWVLSIGAVLGGNATVIGTASNLVGVGLVHKAGYKLSFVEYLKIGGLITLVTLVISTAYIWLRYL